MGEARPTVTITYCRKCHFLPRATWVAQELLHTFAEHVASVTLVPDEGGMFNVAVDGEVIFANQAEGRFPEMRELRELIAARLDDPPRSRHAKD